VGPYDKRQVAAASSIQFFYVEHPPGVLPAEGQRPEDVGCVAKALQTLPLADGGGRATMAEIAAGPQTMLLQLCQRYSTKPDAGTRRASVGVVFRPGTDTSLGALGAA